MSKRYKKFKGNNNGGLLIILLFVLSLVGVLGIVSKGFQEWNFDDWFKKESIVENDNKITLSLNDFEILYPLTNKSYHYVTDRDNIIIEIDLRGVEIGVEDINKFYIKTEAQNLEVYFLVDDDSVTHKSLMLYVSFGSCYRFFDESGTSFGFVSAYVGKNEDENFLQLDSFGFYRTPYITVVNGIVTLYYDGTFEI